jgi:Beta-propeller repeat
MKKHFFLLIYSITFHFISFSQAPTWDWAKGVTNGKKDYGNAITITSNNKVYCVGQFNSPVLSFSPVLLANYDTYYENDDMFIVCYTTSGEVLWAKSMGGNGDDVAKSIAADKAGNIYIAGYFTSAKIGFGKDTLLNSGQSGTNDGFIAKYNSRGEEQWAKNIGGTHDDKANCITVDKDANVYVTGSFFSWKLILQKGDTLKNTGDQSGSSPDIFTAKYTTDGNYVWGKSINGSKYDYGYGITTDTKNNVFVTGGTYSSELHFDTVTITTSKSEIDNQQIWQTTKPTYMLVDDAGKLKDTTGMKIGKISNNKYAAIMPPQTPTVEKIFLAKYSDTGNLQWAESVGGSDDEEGSAITTDKNNNLFITGKFQSSSITLDSTTMNNKGSNDIFIAKYTNDGKTLWAKSVGGIADDRGNAIVTDSLGNAYITGWFGSPKAVFGKCTQLNTGGKDYTDLFIAKYDALGNALWAENAKGNDSEWSNGVAIDKQGNIYITGGFDSAEMWFGNSKLINPKSKSFFVSKISVR